VLTWTIGEELKRTIRQAAADLDKVEMQQLPPFPSSIVTPGFLEGKPNANHVRARISYSRTQQLHNMDIITQCSK
jgi:hypothetical protein